jgi:hypothetical protein
MRKFKHLAGYFLRDYPAADEISALRKKIVPTNINYYYDKSDDTDTPKDSYCTKFHGERVCLQFWRPMQADDVINYAVNTKSYNAQLMKVRKDQQLAKEETISASVPTGLRLMAYMAGGSWPDDLLLLTGVHELQGCGDRPEHVLAAIAWVRA